MKSINKSIQEYAKEMTRKEFDKFTEENELCPSHLGLKDTLKGDECNADNCTKCYDQALTAYTFKTESVAVIMPKESLVILKSLGDLELQAKSIKDQQGKLKADLLSAMETHGIKKWDNDIMTVSYTAATTKNTIDGTKLKADLPEVYKQYTKTSNVKSSIRITLKDTK